MQVASRACDEIFSTLHAHVKVPAAAAERFRAVTRLAALLHDLGHGPLSHTTEFAMPVVNGKKSTHEDDTLKMLLDSGLTPILERAGAAYGFKPRHIAGQIAPELELADDFFVERIGGEKIDFRPLLSQLVSSEL